MVLHFLLGCGLLRPHLFYIKVRHACSLSLLKTSTFFFIIILIIIEGFHIQPDPRRIGESPNYSALVITKNTTNHHLSQVHRLKLSIREHNKVCFHSAFTPQHPTATTNCCPLHHSHTHCSTQKIFIYWNLHRGRVVDYISK